MWHRRSNGKIAGMHEFQHLPQCSELAICQALLTLVRRTHSPATTPAKIIHHVAICTLPLALLLSLLHDLLDNLLLLNQERPRHAILDAVRTSGAAIGALDRLLGLRDLSVFARAKSRDLNMFCQYTIEIERARGALTPGNLVPQSPHLGAVPRFLMCRYLSSPPGVLLMRTLLETVL